MESKRSKSVTRALRLPVGEHNAFFLWGPSKIGKTTYLDEHFASALWLDLLDSRLRTDLSLEPHLLRQRVLASSPPLVVIDESGSSARKVKREHANLLGGRFQELDG